MIIFLWVIKIKLFGTNLPPLFGKLDHFIATQQNLRMFIKWSSLQKSLSKLMQNSFMRLNPGP
jgi:hypothetical protein